MLYPVTDVIITLRTVRDCKAGKPDQEGERAGGNQVHFEEVRGHQRHCEPDDRCRDVQSDVELSGLKEEHCEGDLCQVNIPRHLVEMGVEDERFLDPECVLTFNDMMANMHRDFPAETVLEEFRHRMLRAYA